MKLIIAIITATLLAACTVQGPTAELKEQEAKARKAMSAGASQLENSGAVQEGSALNPPESAYSVEL